MWKICYEFFDEKGESLGSGYRIKTYKRKGYAERMGKKYYGEHEHVVPNGWTDLPPVTMHWWVEKVIDS